MILVAIMYASGALLTFAGILAVAAWTRSFTVEALRVALFAGLVWFLFWPFYFAVLRKITP